MDNVQKITRAIAEGPPGDREALSALYEARFSVIFGLAQRHVGQDEQLCLDIVQETMMRFIRRRPIFDNGAALDAWLSRTVRSVTVDIFRAERRRRQRELAAAHANAQRQEAAASTESADARVDSIAWLRNELERLDDAQARLLEERYRFGRTLAQISASVGINISGVHARLHRALNILRQRSSEVADE